MIQATPATLDQLRVGLPKLNHRLLYLVLFLLPGQVAWINTVCVVMLLFWLLEPGLVGKWRELKGNPIFWAFQAYFWVFVIGLAWTEDLTTGMRMVGRTLQGVLVVPMLLTIVQRDRVPGYINAFLLGITVCVLLAHYNWLQRYHFSDWPTGIVVASLNSEDTAPFVDRLLYAPILAWAGYLCAYQLIESLRPQLRAEIPMKNFGINRAILIYSILMVAIVNNLFFSGGRVGVLALIVLLGLLCVQRLPFRAWQSALCGLALGVAIITLGYLGNEHFSQRFDKGIDEALNYQQRVNTSVGIRINMLVNSSRAFAQAPLLGAGSGDFSSTYRLINEQFSPQWSTTTNPHNQFLLVGVTTGMFGLVALLLVYYPGILRRLQVHKDSDNRHDLRVALAVWITVISLFESYLWRSNTCLLFIAFTCLAYGNSSRTDSVRQVTHVQ